jgi:hypothetical protein
VRLEKEPGYDASGAYEDIVEQAKSIANKYGIAVVVEHHKECGNVQWDEDEEHLYPQDQIELAIRTEDHGVEMDF